MAVYRILYGYIARIWPWSTSERLGSRSEAPVAVAEASSEVEVLIPKQEPQSQELPRVGEDLAMLLMLHSSAAMGNVAPAEK